MASSQSLRITSSLPSSKLQKRDSVLSTRSSNSIASSILGTNANITTPRTFESNCKHSFADTFISVDMLKEISYYLRAQAPWQTEKIEKKINQQLDNIDKTLAFCKENYTYQQAKLLRHAFIKITNLISKNKLATELSYLVGKMLKTTWFEQLKRVNLPKVIEEFTPYGEAGAAKSRTVKFSLAAGAGAEVLGNVGVSATTDLTCSKTLEYSPDDEGLFFKIHMYKGSAGLSAKLGSVAKGSLNINATYADFLEFNNVTAYAENEGTKLKDPKAGIWEKIKYQFSTKSDMHKLRKQEQFTASAYERLITLLTQAEIKYKKEDVTAPFPTQNVPLSGFGLFSVGTLNGSVGVNVGGSDSLFKLDGSLGAGISVTHADIGLYEFVPSALYDIITEHPDKIRELPENLLRRITRENLTNDHQILNVLNKLQKDINEYYQIVRNYDYWVNTNHSNTNERKRLQKAKHKIENNWGAIGRHQLLQTWLASHAYVAYVSNQINERQNDRVTRALNRIRELLSEPTIAYNKALILEIACFQRDVVLTTNENTLSFELQAPIFSGNVTISKRFRTHPNRLREGDYLDISITGKAGLDISNVANLSKISDLIKTTALEKGTWLPDDFSITPDIGIDGSLSLLVRYFKPKYALDKDFPGKKGWRKMLTQTRAALNLKSSVSLGASIAPGFVASGSLGASINKTKVLKEIIDPNDIIYTMTRFNRFYRSNKLESFNQDWLNFTTKHNTQFRQLLHNLANGENLMKAELMYRFDEAFLQATELDLKKQIQSTRKKLVQALNHYHNDPSEANYDNAFVLITKSFTLMAEPWWKHHVGQWGAPKFMAQKQSGLNLNSRIRLGLGLTRRGKVQFEKKKQIDAKNKMELSTKL